MKKRTILGIFLAVIAIIALAVLAIYLTMQYKDDMFSPEGTVAESEADAVLNALHEPVSEAPKEKEAETEAALASSDQFIIWVGDSRTLGMRDAVQNDDLYIGASGEGYDWLSETGLPQVKDAMKDYPEAPIVFNFGVNDYDNMENYLTLYKSLVKEYPDTDFYFLSVNPIEPTQCENITNEEISDFNNHLEEAFPDTYIDSFTFLMANETVTIDGIHYSGDDYRVIHEFASQEVAKRAAK